MHVEPVRTLLETTRLLASACTACSLHEGRARSVFGEGDPHAELLFVGEAPGPDEDRTGRPFTGRSGALLDRIIEAMGKRREEVYLTNVVTCRLNDDRELTRQ